MALTIPVKGQPDWDVTLNQALIDLDSEIALKFTTPVSPPSVTGSRGGNAALASLLTALASLGMITNNTTA
jgi:hypothetical protein